MAAIEREREREKEREEEEGGKKKRRIKRRPCSRALEQTAKKSEEKERKDRRRNVRANNAIPLPVEAAGNGRAYHAKKFVPSHSPLVSLSRVTPVPLFNSCSDPRPATGQTVAATICQSSRDYLIA